VIKARRSPKRGIPVRGYTLVGSGRIHDYQTRLERLVRDKGSSLFGLFFSDEEKSCIILRPGVNVIKLFFSSRMLRRNKLECLFLDIILSNICE
jgi:hypothetical protein